MGDETEKDLLGIATEVALLMKKSPEEIQLLTSSPYFEKEAHEEVIPHTEGIRTPPMTQVWNFDSDNDMGMDIHSSDFPFSSQEEATVAPAGMCINYTNKTTF